MNGKIFLSGFTTLLLMNIIIAFINTSNMAYIVFNLGVGFILGCIIPLAVLLIMAGVKITVLATSVELSDESVNIAFGVGLMIALLFQINISVPIVGAWLGLTLPLGMGLGQNLLQYFPISEGGGLGFFLVSGIILVTFISGILIMKGSGE